MKNVIIAFLVSCPSISIAQSSNQKLSKDSIRYYQRQLREISKAAYDSMVTSEKYKEVSRKLNPNGQSSSDNFGVELTFFSGLQTNDYANLNTRLSSLGIKKVNTLLLPVGIGLAFRFNKIVVGYDMTPLMVGDNSTGAYFHGYLSTNVIKTKKWIFSPQVGYGGQGVTVRIPTQSASSNFNSYFTTSSNQVEVKHSNSVLDFAIAVKLYTKNKNTYVPLFRAGYRHGVTEKAWEIKNGNSTNAPVDRNSNFYVQLMLGFGD